MNRHFQEDHVPLKLGEKIVPPAPAAPAGLSPVGDRPHLFVDKSSGRMCYLPPEPVKDPAKKVAAPATAPTQWRNGKPPAKGWYVASNQSNRGIVRHFDGERWSFVLKDTSSAKMPARTTSQSEIRWLTFEDSSVEMRRLINELDNRKFV